MEHLSQLERAIPTFILNNVLVTEYVEYPNKPKNLKTKVGNTLVHVPFIIDCDFFVCVFKDSVTILLCGTK